MAAIGCTACKGIAKYSSTVCKKISLPQSKLIVRRGRDSNPRYPFEYTHFPGVLLQPLGHLSVKGGQKYAAQTYCPNIFSAFEEVISATSSTEQFFTSANFCA